METAFGTSHQLRVAYVSQLMEAEGAALIPCLGVISQGSSGNELTHLERLFPAAVILNNYIKKKLDVTSRAQSWLSPAALHIFGNLKRNVLKNVC